MKFYTYLFLVFAISIMAKVNAQIEVGQLERSFIDKKDSFGIEDYSLLINVTGNFATNSNSISNNFYNALAYQRTFITESLKDDQSERLKKNNRLGLDASAFVQGEYKFSKTSILFGAGQRVFAAAKFPKDLFEIVFRGNSGFAGEKLNFSKTSLYYFDYQSYYLGIKKESESISYGGTIAFLNGGRYQSLTMNNTSLYTETLGQYIQLEGDINYTRNDKSSTLKKHGKGVGLNLFLSKKRKNNLFNFEIRDIGFIQWKEMSEYQGDGNYQYNGLLINDVLASNTDFASTLTLDSIALSTGLTKSVGSLTTWLPTTVHANYVINPNKRFSRTIGVRYTVSPGYIPKVYVRGVDFLGRGFALANSISYGGFGRFDYEIGLLKKIKNNFIITANLFAFEYLVMAKKSSGNGINVSLTTLF